MQALYDLFPVLAFFVAYEFAGIYVATAVLMAVTVAVAAVQWLRKRSISATLLLTAALALVFGGLTLWLHDQRFIQWKPTILYTLFALALLGSQVFGEAPLLQRLMGDKLKADARTWRTMNVSWALFFLTLAAANLVFVYRFSVATWVHWKLATIGLTFAFAFASSLWLAGRVEQSER